MRKRLNLVFGCRKKASALARVTVCIYRGSPGNIDEHGVLKGVKMLREMPRRGDPLGRSGHLGTGTAEARLHHAL